MKPTTFSQVKQAFIKDRDLFIAEQTVGMYERTLSTFANVIEDKWPINSNDIKAFIRNRREKGNQDGYINIILKCIKTLCRWAVKKKLLKENPFDGLPYQKILQKPQLPPVLTSKEIQAVLETARNIDGYGKRNYAFLMLEMETGMRPGEILSLPVENIDLQSDPPTVKIPKEGKRGERILPITVKTKRAIQSYLRVRKGSSFGPLFLTKEGSPMNRNAITRVLYRIKKRLNLRKLYLYQLRHTFATESLKNGSDLEYVRRMLGHTSFAVTQRYTHYRVDDLAVIQKRASPVNRTR